MITYTIARICQLGKVEATVEIQSSTYLPPEVFLFRAEDDTYAGVCALPGVTGDWPSFKEAGKSFYRKRDVVLAQNSIKELEAALTLIKERLDKLEEDYFLFLTEGKYNETETIVLNEEIV